MDRSWGKSRQKCVPLNNEIHDWHVEHCKGQEEEGRP